MTLTTEHPYLWAVTLIFLLVLYTISVYEFAFSRGAAQALDYGFMFACRECESDLPVEPESLTNGKNDGPLDLKQDE